MALEPIGDMADVSLTEATGPTANESLAQAMARRLGEVRPEQIEAASNVSARKASMYARRVE